MTEYLKELRGFVEGVIKDKDPELLDRLQVRGRRDPMGKPSIIPEVYIALACFAELLASLRGTTAMFLLYSSAGIYNMIFFTLY